MSINPSPQPDALTRDQLLDVLETAVHAQLRALRSLRPSPTRRGRPPAQKGKSNIAIAEDVLKAAPGPLHIQDILAQAQQRFRRKLRRDSLVSALTKKVLDGQTFVRSAPNTFDLAHREAAS
jgi:hypothetical protein